MALTAEAMSCYLRVIYVIHVLSTCASGRGRDSGASTSSGEELRPGGGGISFDTREAIEGHCSARVQSLA